MASCTLCRYWIGFGNSSSSGNTTWSFLGYQLPSKEQNSNCECGTPLRQDLSQKAHILLSASLKVAQQMWTFNLRCRSNMPRAKALAKMRPVPAPAPGWWSACAAPPPVPRSSVWSEKMQLLARSAYSSYYCYYYYYYSYHYYYCYYYY